MAHDDGVTPDLEAQQDESQSFDVCKLVKWYPLGPGIMCQVDSCEQAAYKVCDMQIKKKFCTFEEIAFEGCGKQFCLEHAKFEKGKIKKKYENFLTEKK